MKNDFVKLERIFLGYREKAGNPPYVACFGKTFLDEEDKDYLLAKRVGASVIENGFGVLHGAYTGVMEATSKGADQAISRVGKNKYWNIGIPMRMFDSKLVRSSRVNLPSAENISDRTHALLKFCDVCIVLPIGGFGTFTEILHVILMNQLAQEFGGTIKPIILFGKRWRVLLDTIYKSLDMEDQKAADTFIYFVDSFDEFEVMIKNIKQKM